jgi:hypothetical protein
MPCEWTHSGDSFGYFFEDGDVLPRRGVTAQARRTAACRTSPLLDIVEDLGLATGGKPIVGPLAAENGIMTPHPQSPRPMTELFRLFSKVRANCRSRSSQTSTNEPDPPSKGATGQNST